MSGKHGPGLQSVWPPVSEWELLGSQAAVSEVLPCWEGARGRLLGAGGGA